MRLLIALLSAIVGLALIVGGYRLARVLIPLVGFLAGLSLGGAIISDLAGTVFLGTLLGVVVGLIAGLIFAILAYFYYYIAVVILTGSIGYWAGSSLMLGLGFQPGILSFLSGLLLGVAAGFVAIVANAPRYVLIVLTSFMGAVTAVGSVMLLFHKIPLEAYSYTSAKLALSNSFLWTLATLSLWVIGMVVQAASTPTNYQFEEWNWSEESDHLPTTHSHPTPHVTGA